MRRLGRIFEIGARPQIKEVERCALRTHYLLLIGDGSL
jgi:hypothetical protein